MDYTIMHHPLNMHVARHIASIFVAIAVAGAIYKPARAADSTWKPTKSVEIVIGAQAGGANDRTGRMLQKIMTDINVLPVPVNVINRPGQGQTLAITYLNAHAADPHYLLILGSSWVTSAITSGNPITHRHLTPIIKLFDTDLVSFVPAGSSVRSMKDVADALLTSATPMSFGFSTTAGNVSHIALAEFARMIGYDQKKMRLVVNTSGSITATQVAGNHISAGISSSGSAQAMFSAGKLRLIGTISNRRLPQLPDLPTWREQGYDVVASTWFTVFCPKGITPAQAAYWEHALTNVLRHPETKKFADTNNWTIDPMGAKSLTASLDKEYVRLRKTLVDLGMAH